MMHEKRTYKVTIKAEGGKEGGKDLILVCYDGSSIMEKLHIMAASGVLPYAEYEVELLKSTIIFDDFEKE